MDSPEIIEFQQYISKCVGEKNVDALVQLFTILVQKYESEITAANAANEKFYMDSLSDRVNYDPKEHAELRHPVQRLTTDITAHLSMLDPLRKLPHLENGFRADSCDPNLLLDLGNMLVTTNNPGPAQHIFERMMTLHPCCPESYLQLAILLHKHNVIRVEYQVLLRGLAKSPQHPLLINQLGVVASTDSIFKNMDITRAAFLASASSARRLTRMNPANAPVADVAKHAITGANINCGHVAFCLGQVAKGMRHSMDGILSDPREILGYQNILLDIMYLTPQSEDGIIAEFATFFDIPELTAAIDSLEALPKEEQTEAAKRALISKAVNLVHNFAVRRYLVNSQVKAEMEQGKEELANRRMKNFAASCVNWESRNATRDVIVATPRPEKLRIAVLTSDVHKHAVSYFILEVFRRLNKNRFHTTLFLNNGYDEQILSTLPFDEIVTVVHLSDEETMRRIEASGAHIALDLSGHTNQGRQFVLSLLQTPVLLHWVGYPNDVHIPRVRRISDEFTERCVAERYGAAPPLIMPNNSCFLVYDTLSEDNNRLHLAPRLKEVFDKRIKRIGEYRASCENEIDIPWRFCSMAKLTKFNPETMALWARLLRKYKNSTLHLKSRYLEHAAFVDQWFGEVGVPEDVQHQFVMHGHADEFEDHLDIFSEFDLCFDPTPYSSTTITCECLSRDLPIITLCREEPGTLHVSRVTGSILSQCGLDGVLVARDEDEFESKAVSVLRWIEALHVRQRFFASPMTNHCEFTLRLESALEKAWDERTV